MTTLKNWIMLFLFAVNVSACGAVDSDYTNNVQSFDKSDTSTLTTLTITKVKKPWYAWRGLVVGKMKKSFPEYSAVKGLKHKYYSFTIDHHYFGGIYLWKSEEDSKNWFNQAWFDRTEKKYGEKGVVLSYEIQSITVFSSPERSEGNYFAVLSYNIEPVVEWQKNINGLFQVIELRDSNQKSRYLTLWRDKESLDSFFASKKVDNEYFDVPILLNNSK
jgi:heme-degrading monooxygenase HmoA